MYLINENSVVEIQALGRLHGQRTRNIFHYRYAGVTQLEGKPTIEAMIDEFGDEVFGQALVNLSSEYTLESITGQLIKPVRYRLIEVSYNQPGGVQGSSLPSTSCVVIRRFAELSGGRFQGRSFIPGIPVTSESDSKLAAAVLAAWQVVAGNWGESLEGGTETEPFKNCIAVRDPVSAIDDVSGTFLDTILRVQRRREIGVGE